MYSLIGGWKCHNGLVIPRARVSNAEKVQCAHAELKEEHEEEDHEVEGRVVAEGLVRGPEPADERHGREEDEVEEPEAEGLTEVAAGEQIEQTDYHVREEQANVRWKKRNQHWLQ